jgi:hypothetical protein
METLNRVSAAAYQASASEAPAGDGASTDGTDAGDGSGSAAGDETVEGEFKEV